MMFLALFPYTAAVLSLFSLCSLSLLLSLSVSQFAMSMLVVYASMDVYCSNFEDEKTAAQCTLKKKKMMFPRLLPEREARFL